MNINEIASLAGVSRATVSRYLNQGYVSQEKKEKIQKVIDETGYRPLAQAQTMRTRKTYLIGVIIPKINSDSISLVIKGVTKTLSEAGYQTLLANTDNDEKKELKYLNIFQQHQVDGILLLGTILTKEHQAELKKIKIPLVVLGQKSRWNSCVYHDDYNAMKELTERVARKGQQIGYIGVTKQDEAVGRQRYLGFLNVMGELKKEFDESWYREAAFDAESGYEKAEEILEQHPGLDTLICATDTIAIGALRCLKDHGRKIPEDVQLAGMGASRISEICEPHLTTVHYYYEECGIEGARILLTQLQEGQNLKRQTKLSYDVVIRGSVR